VFSFFIAIVTRIINANDQEQEGGGCESNKEDSPQETKLKVTTCMENNARAGFQKATTRQGGYYNERRQGGQKQRQMVTKNLV
jgi:hypothetical protein